MCPKYHVTRCGSKIRTCTRPHRWSDRHEHNVPKWERIHGHMVVSGIFGCLEIHSSFLFILLMEEVLHDAGIKLNTYRPPVLEYKDYCTLKLRFLNPETVGFEKWRALFPRCHSQVPSSICAVFFLGWCNYPLGRVISLAYLVPGR